MIKTWWFGHLQLFRDLWERSRTGPETPDCKERDGAGPYRSTSNASWCKRTAEFRRTANRDPRVTHIHIIHDCASGCAVHSGTGTGGAVIVQSDNQHLGGLLHQGLAVIREKQVVVRNSITHWVVGTDDIQERGEEWERMSGEEKTFLEHRSRKQKSAALGRDRHLTPQEFVLMTKHSHLL